MAVQKTERCLTSRSLFGVIQVPEAMWLPDGWMCVRWLIDGSDKQIDELVNLFVNPGINLANLLVNLLVSSVNLLINLFVNLCQPYKTPSTYLSTLSTCLSTHSICSSISVELQSICQPRQPARLTCQPCQPAAGQLLGVISTELSYIRKNLIWTKQFSRRSIGKFFFVTSFVFAFNTVPKS